jgi:hypothetical protein
VAIQRVKPGDLITADLINQMIDAINRLEKAVASCERRRRHSGPTRKQKARRKRSKIKG